MKRKVIFLALLISITAFAQQMTWEQWEEESKTNIRLLPKYGNKEKTKGQKEADADFIAVVLKRDSTHKKGSEHMLNLGFKYLYKDTKIAMYRFNQAYLLDPKNIHVYSGFGAVYMVLGQYQKAKEQYEEGLSKAPDNPHLLVNYGTYFMEQYYNLEPLKKEIALQNLEKAIFYLTKSYALDPTDQNTVFKLSVVHWNKGDCENAWKYYMECKALGGQPITEVYTIDLEKKCKGK